MTDLRFLPLIPISEEKVVHIGLHREAIDILATEPGELRDIVIPLHEAYGTPLIMDMDGIAADTPQIELLQKIAKSFPIWYDGGARDVTDVIDFLVANAEVCCVSTRSVPGFWLIEEAVDLSENICLQIDVYKGDFLASNRKIEKKGLSGLANFAEELGIKQVSYLDYAQFMEMETNPEDFAPLLDRDFELYVGGLKPAKTEEWKAMGLTGIIVYYRTLFEYKHMNLELKDDDLPDPSVNAVKKVDPQAVTG